MTATIEYAPAVAQPQAPAPRGHGWNVAAVVVLAVAALVGFTALTTPDAAEAMAERPPRTFQFDGHGARVLAVTVDGEGTVRRQLGVELNLWGVRSVTVTALSSKVMDAECAITVNGEVVDQEFASGGGQALCVWAARR